MTISMTLKKLKALKDAISKDGKVEYDEATVLLDFISDYVKAGNKKFIGLHRVLVKAQIDGIISKEESDDIFIEIDDIISFLEKEKNVETFVAWFLGLLFVYLIFMCF